jgi:hypothetical protein
MTEKNNAWPPSPRFSSRRSLFLIGKDSRGNWVVQDEHGLHGGLFVNRVDALKYALFENGHRPQAVVMVPGTLELDMSGGARPSSQARSAGTAQEHRRAA